MEFFKQLPRTVAAEIGLHTAIHAMTTQLRDRNNSTMVWHYFSTGLTDDRQNDHLEDSAEVLRTRFGVTRPVKIDDNRNDLKCENLICEDRPSSSESSGKN